MAKFMIVSHRGEAGELLESLQQAGICQILNADSAAVSKEMKDLGRGGEKPRDIEETLARLTKAIAFLKPYSKQAGGLAAVLAPRAVVDGNTYEQVTTDEAILEVITECNETETAIEKLKTEIDNLNSRLEESKPWEGLDVVVDELGRLKQAKCWTGLVPTQRFEQLQKDGSESGAVIEQVGEAKGKYACIIVSHRGQAEEIGKLLRSAEFEQANFAGITGTVAEAITEISQKLEKASDDLAKYRAKAESLAKHLLKLEILYDHYSNLLKRQQTEQTAPATQQTVILEGWVKQKNFPNLEKIVGRFSASSLHKIEPAEGEEIPVEIENKSVIRPFEVITRLYGMPRYLEVDPTICLAPFFALFFGICIGDVGYGLIMLVLSIWAVKKMQGDKKLLLMLMICSIFAIIFGALTGGWFGDALQQFEFLAFLRPVKDRLMWFDPFAQPMVFFGLSLALGYTQIMAGLTIAFVSNLIRKNFVAAVCDQLTWLVMLNSIVLFAVGKAGVIPAPIGRVAGFVALVPAATIFLFSNREGNWGSRLGMGFYNLFSSVFYIGDVLSYLRLMGLSMVGAGLAMAFNLMAKQAMGIPYGIGIVFMLVILIGGHGFNLALSVLGAFVHTLRLQYVEYFPKFFAGGGKAFEPLSKQYKYIYIPRVSKSLAK
jgi:V/A-type H+-transporting ATPase subunit I